MPALPDHLPVARHLWRCSAGEHELADAGQGGLRRLKYCTKNGFGMIPRFIFATKQSTGLEAPLVSWGAMSQPIASNPEASNSIFWVRRMGSDPSIAYENANSFFYILVSPKNNRAFLIKSSVKRFFNIYIYIYAQYNFLCMSPSPPSPPSPLFPPFAPSSPSPPFSPSAPSAPPLAGPRPPNHVVLYCVSVQIFSWACFVDIMRLVFVFSLFAVFSHLSFFRFYFLNSFSLG